MVWSKPPSKKQGYAGSLFPHDTLLSNNAFERTVSQSGCVEQYAPAAQKEGSPRAAFAFGVSA